MGIERTLCIIKPDAVEKRKQGHIVQRLLDEGFAILAMKQLTLSRAVAEGFYAVHRERPFFTDLVAFMTRGPVVVVALEREEAVSHYRQVIGATDPAKAEAGTVRKLYGSNVGENAVHGSDSVDNGRQEVAYFFAESEISRVRR
ncbi:MAG TPA: nucleoside-diphosphate kinase [Polyangiaceae bacterium]|nr:nucleoside-diphosphate kinase [Polyangiaceae bacterium]